MCGARTGAGEPEPAPLSLLAGEADLGPWLVGQLQGWEGPLGAGGGSVPGRARPRCAAGSAGAGLLRANLPVSPSLVDLELLAGAGAQAGQSCLSGSARRGSPSDG